GLNRTHAANIVKHRNEKGVFASRKDLNDVPGIGAKSFEQAAGFLRIPDAKNPLDNSAVHPERYPLVIRMAEDMKADIEEIIGNAQKIKSIDKNKFVSNEVGLPTIEDILAEIEKPGRDPRDTFKYATFDENIQKISDLTPGMALEGTVTNVTNFGAFVDLGVHQDGLVHISQLADRFVDDPQKVVKVGQVVNVRVLEVDEDLKRIALSMKQDPGAPRPRRPEQHSTRPGRSNKQTRSMDEKEKSDNFSGKQHGHKKKLVTYKPKINIKSFLK
ncbi:MAG: S1 RNA-binding domain-containing protein, partial [Chitinivibrionales bacterium]|nr:S1 RNA-binding domain-containing protein [Chitinivibrionales bacterium]